MNEEQYYEAMIKILTLKLDVLMAAGDRLETVMVISNSHPDTNLNEIERIDAEHAVSLWQSTKSTINSVM